jgi:PhoPQ-activated pathogenicity-related protein
MKKRVFFVLFAISFLALLLLNTTTKLQNNQYVNNLYSVIDDAMEQQNMYYCKIDRTKIADNGMRIVQLDEEQWKLYQQSTIRQD